jgi:hypothetical protein
MITLVTRGDAVAEGKGGMADEASVTAGRIVMWLMGVGAGTPGAGAVASRAGALGRVMG